MKRWLWATSVVTSLLAVACGDDAPAPVDASDVEGDAGSADSSAEADASDAGADGDGGYPWQLPFSFPLPPPVPADNPMTEIKVQLGRHLFYDKRMSGNDTQSCATCHVQSKAFTDGRATGLGSTGESHPRGSMSLANVGYFASLTWANPTITSLEDQALTPMFGKTPIELGAEENALVAKLRADDTYQQMFPEAFPDDADPFSVLNVTRAIASFERTLISGSSPFDRFYYEGDKTAISAAAARGADMVNRDPSNRFECNHCHGGDFFSNAVSHTNQVNPAPVFFNTGLYNLDNRGAYPANNRGRMEVTGKPEHMGQFKPPSLRNVAITAPYMHDGSAVTLDDVIDHYARGGRYIMSGPNFGDGHESPLRDPLVQGFNLGDGSERGDLKAFLESLTDDEFINDPRHANPWPAGSPANGTPER